MLALVARVRGWVAPIVVAAGVVVVAVALGSQAVAVPLTDGPRHVRHYLVALAPSFASAVLTDHVPAISANLLREPSLRRVDLALYWLITASVAPSLFGLALDSPEGRYCLVIGLLLAGFALLSARVLGHTGVFASALLGIMWLMFGDTVAPLLGFDLNQPYISLQPHPTAPVWGAVAVAIGCSVTALWLPHRQPVG